MLETFITWISWALYFYLECLFYSVLKLDKHSFINKTCQKNLKHTSQLISQIFTNNSILDNSGLISLCSPSSGYFTPLAKILCSNILQALTGLIPQKAHGTDGISHIVPQNSASVLATCLTNIFSPVYRLLSILRTGKLPEFSLSLKSVTVKIPPAIL